MNLLLSLFIVFLLSTVPISAADYVIEEMIEEGSLPPPFSIARVEPFPDGLRLFLSSADIAAVASLVASGALEGQLSDNQSGIETSVALSLGKAGAPRITSLSTSATPKRCRLAPIAASSRSVSSTS